MLNRQIKLKLDAKCQPEDLWDRLPKQSQEEIIRLYTRLIARVAKAKQPPQSRTIVEAKMGPTKENRTKILPEHLDRAAYVYVRQSTPYQVERHLGSKTRQYDMAKWADELGWSSTKIVTVDDDQGKSGTRPNVRAAFGQMVKAVARGDVGIVIGLEASRLARNNPDWASLIYVCRHTNTLIADEHGIYDPASNTDRLVLGIRGQMSEMELDTSIHRMIEGRLNKALRGEFLIYPTAGYDVDDFDNIVISRDEAIVNAYRLLFSKFDELPSVKRLHAWWIKEGLKFPLRHLHLRSRPVVWIKPEYQHFLSILHDPVYAGAYKFGGTQSIRELDPDDPYKLRIRRVKRDTWAVLIKDHHPAYISFEKYEENQQRIWDNLQMKRYDHDGKKGPAREGQALLQGLARCGKCGRRMYVNYGGSRPSNRTARVLQYRCSAERNRFGGTDCQLIGSGKRVNDVVVEAFLEATRLAGEEASRLAAEQLLEDNEQSEQAWQLQIEKAEYEARRAERQFNEVEPENRLVARTLEARWNACLEEVERLRDKAKATRHQRRPLSEIEIERAGRLGKDIETVWHAETTTHQDRKQLLRAAIEEVQLRTEEKSYQVKIVWKGGAVTERKVKRNSPGLTSSATPEDTIDMVRKLAKELDDAQIARVLNKQGRRTGLGNAFSAQKVATLRYRNKIPACPKKTVRDPREGPFSADEAAAELDVTSSTIHRWLRSGILAGSQIAPGAPWRIILTEEIRRKLTGGNAPAGWVGLTQAAKELGLTKSSVAHMVNTGKLDAVRVTVGKRLVWKIDVFSATCGRQNKLF